MEPESKLLTIGYVTSCSLSLYSFLISSSSSSSSHAYRARLAEGLTKAGDTESERMMDIYERLEELDAATAETKAARILHGLLGRYPGV